ncbi:LysR family transcriptional regulator [Enterococcus faecalis]|uniref:LysR family transcriptional regulator n=1 Tax=Enterococcus faecalis TaxID=1351 RepID=UPI002DB71CC5|nr:LysR family transcriptional regulator [Enterococcus faecalis]MEB7792160.1 LysR family transcriptional regulator [Enterococcus faecalis]MEB7810196.1 LysR family transcriptional regulator [Enterococcus faecalis]
MNHSKLITFCKLCELKKGNLVSKELNITPSTVSFHIQSLENEIGEQLFFRQSGGFSPTPIGEGVYEYAKKILNVQEELSYFINNHQQGTRGKLRVGFSEVSNQAILPQFIHRFSQHYPNIKLSIISDTSPMIEQLLVDFKLDYCVLVGPPINKDLSYEQIGTDRLKIVCGKSHAFSQKSTLTKTDVLNQKMLFHEKQSSTKAIVGHWLDTSYEQLNIIELDSISTMKRVLMYGQTIAFISDLLIKDEVDQNTLIPFEIPISNGNANRNIYLATNKNRNTNTTAMDYDFRKILIDCFIQA